MAMAGKLRTGEANDKNVPPSQNIGCKILGKNTSLRARRHIEWNLSFNYSHN